ncbi:MAG TPA: MliC family protein [Candidatus Accumulibacter phosphatis]|nr:MliC family protein [Candidatus Accumulibacter phosphatis]HRQ94736.1 MliC family protein [Candidatus Accumulibacter phosphatis]
MKRDFVPVRAFLACALGLPVAALAEGPTFSCAKAQGEVEKLICADASLAALDRKLDEVYKAASAKAKGKLATQLRGEQRGWVKGRNDCWKANGQETWITATWTVNTVKGCVDAQYRLRTSELQAVWRLLSPRTVSYACQNNPANEVVANFFETDPATIRLERGDRTLTLWRVGAASDGKYEGQNVSLVHQGSELKVNWLDTNTGKTDDLQCKAR